MICVTASLMHGYCVDPTHARSVAPCGCYLTPCKKYWESTGSKKIPFDSKVVTNNPRIKFTLRCLRSKPIALPGSTHLPTSLPNSFYCMLTFTSSGHTRYQTRTFQHTLATICDKNPKALYHLCKCDSLGFGNPRTLLATKDMIWYAEQSSCGNQLPGTLRHTAGIWYSYVFLRRESIGWPTLPYSSCLTATGYTICPQTFWHLAMSASVKMMHKRG